MTDMGRLFLHDFHTILAKHPGYTPQIFIETGTRYATQMIIAAEVFPRLYGIELNGHNYQQSVSALRTYPQAHMIKGDTRVQLPKLLAKIQEPVFCCLDAHFTKQKPALPKTEFPLWDELAFFKTRLWPDILVVDDVHTFGKIRPAMKHAPDAIGWESVTQESLLAYFGPRVLSWDIIGDGFVMWMG